MEKVRPWCGQPSDRGRLKEQEQHGCYRHAVDQLSVMSAPVCRLHQGLTAWCVRHLLQSLLHRQVLKRISTPPLFIYCLVLHRLYSSGYYGVTAHTVFIPLAVILLVSNGKSMLQRHVLKPYCRTLRIYRCHQCH